MDRDRRRDGSTLVVVLVCLLVLSLLLGAIIRMSVLHRRQVRREQHRLQADWLVEAGIERAASRLRKDPNYSGEQWEIPADRFDETHAGEITIAVKPIVDDPGRREVRVNSRFPSNNTLFASRTRSVFVALTGDQSKKEEPTESTDTVP